MPGDQSRQYNRRQVLQATAGVSAVGGLVSGTALAASSKTEKIITHKHGDEPLITKEVPRKWKAQLETARKAKERIKNQHIENDAVKSLSLTSSDERIEGRNKFSVKVEVDPDKPAPAFPDSPQGVPLKTIEYKERRPMRQTCHGDVDRDMLPGGVSLDGGTSGSPYFHDYDNDGYLEPMHLTCGHILGNNCYNLEGNSVSQKSDNWGSVEVHDTNIDAALCTPNADPDYSVDDQIEEPGGSVDVNGYVTKDGLADLCDDNTTVYKTGIMTGKKDGAVEDIGIYARQPVQCANYEGEGVGLDIHTYPGDSGGPIYDDTVYGVTIIGITSGGYDETNMWRCVIGDNMFGRTEAPSAYHIKDKLGGRFTNPNP